MKNGLLLSSVKIEESSSGVTRSSSCLYCYKTWEIGAVTPITLILFLLRGKNKHRARLQVFTLKTNPYSLRNVTGFSLQSLELRSPSGFHTEFPRACVSPDDPSELPNNEELPQPTFNLDILTLSTKDLISFLKLRFLGVVTKTQVPVPRAHSTLTLCLGLKNKIHPSPLEGLIGFIKRLMN